MNKKILSIVLSIIMVVALVGSNGNSVLAADKKASSYLSSQTLDVNNIYIGLTESEFKKQCASDEKVAFERQFRGYYSDNSEIISFVENGCLMINEETIRGGLSMTESYVGVFTNKSCMDSYFTSYKSASEKIPVDANNTVYISSGSTSGSSYGTAYGWINFVPSSSIIKLDYCIENEDGTYTFYLKNISKSIDYSSVCALEGTLTASEAYKNYQSAELIGSTTDTGAKITLPKKGAYTLYTTVYMDDGSSMPFSFNIKTSDYVKSSKVKMEKPLAAYAGTKVIIGKAEPDATVSCKYLSKTYTATANDLGLYVIKVNSELVKGKSFKIWQKQGKVKSANRTVKITE